MQRVGSEHLALGVGPFGRLEGPHDDGLGIEDGVQLHNIAQPLVHLREAQVPVAIRIEKREKLLPLCL